VDVPPSHSRKEPVVIDRNDREYLVDTFNKRIDADGEAMRAYWAGRIDGHCLQNAIGLRDLRELAAREGFSVDWTSALLEDGS
jgi:hypothetical protein